MADPRTTFEDFATALNNHDLAGLMAQFCNDPSVGLTTDRQMYQGTAAVTRLFDSALSAFPDISGVKVAVMQTTDNPPRIVAQASLSGTHRGVWDPGLDTSALNHQSATNRKFSNLPACAIFSFDNSGKILNLAVYFDRTVVLRSLGFRNL